MQSAKARGVNVFRRTGRRRSGAQANLCPAPTEYDGHMTRIIAASTFIADAASSAAKAGCAVVTVLTAAMLPILFNQQRRCYRLSDANSAICSMIRSRLVRPQEPAFAGVA
jgi:hypothetical protein